MADPNAFTQLREAIPAIRHYHCLNSGGVAPTPQATLDLQQSFYDREAVMTTTNPDLREIYNGELAPFAAKSPRCSAPSRTRSRSSAQSRKPSPSWPPPSSCNVATA